MTTNGATTAPVSMMICASSMIALFANGPGPWVQAGTTLMRRADVRRSTASGPGAMSAHPARLATAAMFSAAAASDPGLLAKILTTIALPAGVKTLRSSPD